jgi:hypothetical protein
MMKRKNVEKGECPMCHNSSPLRYTIQHKKIFVCKKCRPHIAA